MKQRFLSFFSLVALLSVSPIVAWAQYSRQQNFETTNSGSLIFTPTGGGQYFSGNSSTAFSSANSKPANSPVYTSGQSSYGAQNNTGSGVVSTTLDFSNVKFTSLTNNFLTFRLAAFATNNNGGIDATGSVVVGINMDGGLTDVYTTAATIQGSGNGRDVVWDFSGNGQATVNFPNTNQAAPTVFTANTSTNYTIIRVNFGQSVLNAKVRITLRANDKTALLVDDVFIGSQGPLPVTLTNFTASRQSSNVYVKWATATELNNAYFEVQRSDDSKTFATVGKVTGNGTTATGASYSFTDRNPLAATSYYRLRQVDNDATESYSSVVAVSGTDKIEASFYPNPSNSTVTLPAVNGLVKYRVYTATGQSVAAGEAQGGSEINIQKVPTGIYFLELISADKHNVQRFVKQ